jgi:hypothetical protein
MIDLAGSGQMALVDADGHPVLGPALCAAPRWLFIGAASSASYIAGSTPPGETFDQKAIGDERA